MVLHQEGNYGFSFGLSASQMKRRYMCRLRVMKIDVEFVNLMLQAINKIRNDDRLFEFYTV
jgi:hypothetical protein